MNTVVATGLITGGVGVIGTVTTAIVSVKNSAAQALAQRRQLEAEHREADRRVRRDAYLQLLISIEQLDMLTSAWTEPPTLADYQAWIDSWRRAGAAVRLVESPEVADARRAVGRLLDAVGEKLMHNIDANMTMIDALGIPYVEMREEIAAAGRVLGNAMRDDLAFAADNASATA